MALHRSAENGHEALDHLLMEKGTNVDAQDCDDTERLKKSRRK